ncbi:MAG: Nramp family divalent metal transporter [Myxococcales bacterium]
MLGLPTTATAPFCPSEVRGTVAVAARGEAPAWRRFLQFAGPGLLVSVGYMDPGNWATDIEAGSRYGYGLLFVVVLSSLAAIVLQCLSMRLGIVTGKDLARQSRDQLPRATNLVLWASGEVAIVACDLAEVLGGALAFHLLLGCSIPAGIALTALDTIVVLALQGQGFRRLEAIVLGLIATIGICFIVELWLVHPAWREVARGALPSASLLTDRHAWLVALGIMGATVMPHNLYLHSSIVQSRDLGADEASRASAVRFATLDTVGSLVVALLINAAILVLAGAAFHGVGGAPVTDIEGAYHLLDPVVGSGLASTLFALALLASGQSATFTGTIAGQVLMEGSLDLKIPCWQRRLITRVLALLPAFIGVAVLGEGAIGKMLIASQVVLSFQLPFAIAPLLLFTQDRRLMRSFASGPWLKGAGWGLFAAITAANLWLFAQLF